jgi:hypothetical protein
MEFNPIKELNDYFHNLSIIDMRLIFEEIDPNLFEPIEKYNSIFFENCKEFLSNKFYHTQNTFDNILFIHELERNMEDIKIINEKILKQLVDKNRISFLTTSNSYNSFYKWTKKRTLEILKNSSIKSNTKNLLDKSIKTYGNLSSPLFWSGTKNDLAEVLHGLILNENIKGANSNEEIFKIFSNILNTDVSYKTSRENIQKRLQDKKTKILPKLNALVIKYLAL